MIMAVKKTQEEFEQEIYELYEEEYKVIGEYTGANGKIGLKHKECGREFEARVYKTIKGKVECPRCNKGGRKNHSDFLYEVNELVGDEYTVLTEYTDRKSEVDIKHNVCGNINSVVPMNFINGSRCLDCSYKARGEATRLSYTEEEYKEKVKEERGEEFTVLSDYTGIHETVSIRHSVCGRTHSINARHFLKSRTCRGCSNLKARKTDEEYKSEVYELVGEEFTVLGKYEHSRKKVLVRHNECGHEWEVNPTSFLTFGKCPSCSHAERVKRQRKTEG